MKENENVIFVGSKPFMNYVTAVVMQFTTKKAKEVIVKSRGKFITKAVDVSEVSKNKFLKNEKIKTEEVKIGTEEFETEDKKKISVSTIEIVLIKNP